MLFIFILYRKKVSYNVVKSPNAEAWVVNADGDIFSPNQIAAFVIAKMKSTAEDYLNQQIQNAIITVPTYFDDAQRQVNWIWFCFTLSGNDVGLF